MTMTRADVERIRDAIAGCNVWLGDEGLCDQWKDPAYPHGVEASQVRDLATTCLGLMEWESLGREYAASGGRDAVVAREARIASLELAIEVAKGSLTQGIERQRALEEGLRDAIVEAHGHGLLRDHPEGTSAGVDCPAVICRDTRDLLTERSENVKEGVACVRPRGIPDDPEDMPRAERPLDRAGYGEGGAAE